MSLKPFTQLTSKTLVLPQTDIDTDQIIPARFLTTTTREGLADKAFHDWRFESDGQEKADHPFKDVDMATHTILVGGDNFGCGSSREHAPWALSALGVQVVISTQIADIFRSNSLKNGLLTVEVPEEVHSILLNHPGQEVTVDLEAEELRFGNHVVTFQTDPFARRSLLEGQDSMGMLIDAIPQIEAFEQEMGR